MGGLFEGLNESQCWGMYFVAAALETISILRALYISSEITWNYMYQKFRAKWSVFDCICQCIHFHNPHLPRPSDAWNTFGSLTMLATNSRLKRLAFAKFQNLTEIQNLKSRFLENVLTNSRLIFVHLWPGVCWQGRGLACRAGIVDRIMVPTIKCLSVGWTDMSWEQM